jgi:VanZ family protein
MNSGTLPAIMKQGRRSVHILCLLAPIFWALIIFYLSLTTSPPQLPGVLGWDKLLHAGAYGLLSILLAQAFLFPPFSLNKPWWLAGFTAVAFGALLEVLQLVSQAGRTAEWLDLLADAVGAFFCCVIFRHVVKRHCCHNGKPDVKNG